MTFLSDTEGLPQKASHLKNDLLLVFQKRRLRLDTKSKCQNDLILVSIKNTDTYSQGYYYCQTKSSHYPDEVAKGKTR
jgi:hypothetical protein